jgi:hypothetical protein
MATDNQREIKLQLRAVREAISRQPFSTRDYLSGRFYAGADLVSVVARNRDGTRSYKDSSKVCT